MNNLVTCGNKKYLATILYDFNQKNNKSIYDCK